VTTCDAGPGVSNLCIPKASEELADQDVDHEVAIPKTWMLRNETLLKLLGRLLVELVTSHCTQREYPAQASTLRNRELETEAPIDYRMRGLIDLA
jgi:hypothetical protein